ncbi:helix-turn-helix domain-containing protein [Streptomyces spiramenti]|uniref:Helix-turn-helix transcriptional regulator n=1 Tax=Streptomyces spiramenti TaxID=2720606 RepID=A0ABX1AS12_9ACTN|nr:helix-turn-helix transcriptional regulator [Streptomyces spiramenti]NJP67503.1 helix-turn-helix transcriptional regulator [Streptomyces spiramenti]
MPSGTVTHTGARIRRARKLRGLTQQALADLAPGVSYSTLTKVEQGQLPASPGVVAALARGLGTSVEELTGQPYLAELRQDQLVGLMQPLREALDLFDIASAPLTSPRSAAELAGASDGVARLVRATNLRQAASELPALIQEATAAAHSRGGFETWRVLATLYRSTYDVAQKLGFPDLSTVALDRVGWASERGSDPVFAALRQYFRALSYLRGGDYETGRRLISSGHGLLGDAQEGREKNAVVGQLHLGASVLAARAGDSAADSHLDEADRLADLTGPAESLHWLSFGPTNVAAHRVSVLAERTEYAAAVAVARDMTVPTSWPRSRASHHHAEVARALMWTGDTDAAFRQLQAARSAGPQQAKYHPVVRQTWEGLEASRRRSAAGFSSFGSWLGM